RRPETARWGASASAEARGPHLGASSWALLARWHAVRCARGGQMGRWWLAWILCGGCGLITPVGVPDELVDKDGVAETDAVQESPVVDTYEGSWDTDRGDTDESPNDTDKGQDSSSWPDSGDSGHSGFPGGGGGTGTCGDGVRGGYEDCDGADLSGLTC